MLSKRLVTGVAMASIFVAVIVADERLAPWYPFWLALSVLVMGVTAHETVGLLQRTSAAPSSRTVLGGVMALIAANWAPHITAQWHWGVIQPSAPFAPHAVDPALVLAWPLWTFAGILMFAFIAQSAQFDRPGGTMASIAGTVLAVAYVGLLGSFIIQLRWLAGRYEGLLALAALVATAKGTDVGAYTLGRIAGRHKLWPRLSPNKTVEGALGGLVFGLAACVGTVGIGHNLLGVPSLNWPQAIGFGLVVSASAQLGDLMESMIKRDCSQKDASATLPGFGGLLDVMDSLLFAGPVAYGYWIACRP